MPSITRAELASARRRSAQPTREPGDLLAVFVEGKLVNPLNARRGWRPVWRYSKDAKERVWNALLATGMRTPTPLCVSIRKVRYMHDVLKAITFVAHVGAEWDDDNLRAALKPHRDALRDAGLIDDDAPRAGHTFTYGQIIDRKRGGRRGVTILVRLRILT